MKNRRPRFLPLGMVKVPYQWIRTKKILWAHLPTATHCGQATLYSARLIAASWTNPIWRSDQIAAQLARLAVIIMWPAAAAPSRSPPVTRNASHITRPGIELGQPQHPLVSGPDQVRRGEHGLAAHLPAACVRARAQSGRASSRCSSGAWSIFAAAYLDGLVRIVKRKLKKIRYWPHLINGCLTATG